MSVTDFHVSHDLYMIKKGNWHIRLIRIGILSFFLAVTPAIAFAQMTSQVVGYLNILAGLMLVVSCLTFGAGFIVYISRLQLPYRDWGIDIMSWGVTILFVLVLMLALISFVQNHLRVTLSIVAVVLVLLLGGAVLSMIRAAATKKKEE